MYKDLFHSTVFTKKTIPGISFIYKEFRGFLALKVLKMRYMIPQFPETNHLIRNILRNKPNIIITLCT